MQIEYLENNHIYIIDGIMVPSVSKLVAYATGDIYQNIPKHILEAAQIHGTAVHEAIENYERSGAIDEEHAKEVEAYIELKQKYLLHPKDMEQIVHYEKHFCGRYDILDQEGNLWDIKTTSKYHEENLEWQLGLYYLGLGKEKDVGYCIHIPKKGKPKVRMVKPKTNKECIDLIETYEKSNTSTEDPEKS